MALFTKIVLCASGNYLTAGVWSWRKLRAFQVFDHDAPGKAEFARFLQQFPDTNIYLLADAVEEDYRLENLPHTSGAARHALLERKLSQTYRNTAFRAAHFIKHEIKREKDKRKDDRYVFLALNKVEFLSGWLAVIEAQQALLTGVYMLSMLSQVIVQKVIVRNGIVRNMRLIEPHIILSERLNSGLRQTYLHNGNLKISRLAAMPPEAENQRAYFYELETEKTSLYLISQGFINPETPLKMLLPELDDSSKDIRRQIQQEQGIDCERIDLAELASSIRIQPQLLKANPELLHMHLLAIGHVPDNLAPARLVRPHQVQRISLGINFASALIVFIGLMLTAVYVKQAADLSAETRQAALDTELYNQRYADVARDFPATPMVSNDLATAVEINKTIKQYGKAPRRMMQVISHALDVTLEIQLDRLHWLQTNEFDVQDDDKILDYVPSDKSNPPSSFVPDPSVLYEVGFINGQIKMFNGDYRRALESVNHLATLLRADSLVENVEILQSPVNVSSYSALQGSTNDEKSALQSAAMFKLRVILKPEVPVI